MFSVHPFDTVKLADNRLDLVDDLEKTLGLTALVLRNGDRTYGA
jgi:hypothetical protein